MHTPITVNYVPDGADWKVTVTDEDQTQSATASGLIAARDQADQIVEKMVPNQTGRTVVHLLEGDALAFTNSYLQVRLGLTTPAAPSVEPATEPSTPEATAADTPTEAPDSAPSDSTALAAAAPDSPAPTAAAPSPPPTIPAPTIPTPAAAPTPAAGATSPPTTAEALTPPNPDTTPTTPSPDKSPELADVPAQGVNQPS